MVKNIWYGSREEYIRSGWRYLVYKSQKFSRNFPATTHGTVDKVFGWKELLGKSIWRLQVQSQPQIRIKRNTNLTLVLGHF